MRIIVLILAGMLAACEEFPEIAGTVVVDDQSPYPALVPLGPILAQADQRQTAPAN